jgi:hypothetical protein
MTIDVGGEKSNFVRIGRLLTPDWLQQSGDDVTYIGGTDPDVMRNVTADLGD